MLLVQISGKCDIIQLRWLQRKEDNGDWTKTLQYRFLYDPTIYAGFPHNPPNPHPLNKQVWSDWVDVPFVEEE